jgi:serine kinase of HPr protein (carbohydrate metabolism regulator)
MNLAELVERLSLKVYAGGEALARAVGGGYAGDLLSDVIANGKKDQVWITIQVHPNIVAVAVLKELAAIVVANGREPAAETVDRARKEQVPILGTALTAFELAGRLHGLGLGDG